VVEASRLQSLRRRRQLRSDVKNLRGGEAVGETAVFEEVGEVAVVDGRHDAEHGTALAESGGRKEHSVLRVERPYHLSAFPFSLSVVRVFAGEIRGKVVPRAGLAISVHRSERPLSDDQAALVLGGRVTF
jgi:hypothetical protein